MGHCLGDAGRCRAAQGPMPRLLRRAFRLGVFLLALGASISSATTTLPDTDETQSNNTPARAENLGELRLTASPSTDRVRIRRTGQLGQVLGGFDTVDYYKFDVVEEHTIVRFQSTEAPQFSSYVTLTAAGGDTPTELRGNAGEFFQLPLPRGRYFLALATSPPAARGRLVEYSFDLEASRSPAPNFGHPSCRGAPLLGAVPRTGIEVVGSLQQSNWVSAYSFVVETGGQFGATLIHNGDAVATLYAGTRPDAPIPGGWSMRPGSPATGSVLLDPGLYCIAVHYPACAPHHRCLTPNPPVTVQNYKLQLVAHPIGPPGAPTKERALQLTLFDVGEASSNGYYQHSRHLYAYRTGAGVPAAHIRGRHVLREMVDSRRPELFVSFGVETARRYKFQVDDLLEPVRAQVLNASGHLISELPSTPQPRFDGSIRSLYLEVDLVPGSYYVRIFSPFTRIGTPVRLDVWH